jgi:hypothetical protein
MRSRLILLTLSIYFVIALLGCNKPPASDSGSSTDANATGTTASSDKDASRDEKEQREHAEAKREPVVVPTGTSITVSLGSAIGSKLSQTGQTFAGSVAKDVLVHQAVAIPRGTNVSGTITEAKPLGKLAGGAVLEVRLDTINLHGADIPVQASARTFTQKGKGKRTAVLAGGGAALGGLIGGLAGGGKGAAIGLAAGGGAGAGGSALAGNKEIVLPAEADITFELSQALEIRR